MKSVRDRQGVTLIRFFFLLSASPLSLWYNVVFFFEFSFFGHVCSYLIPDEFSDVTERFIYLFFISYSLFQRSTRQYSVPSRNSSYSGSSQKVADQSEQPVDNMSKCINKQSIF